jgi:hypothetical protein
MNDKEILTWLRDAYATWSNEVLMVPVTFILRYAQNSCDFGDVDEYQSETDFWLDVISSKARDTGFGHLIDAILEHGWQDDSAVGFDGHSITEGHHRLVAAILLGMDEVPISPYGKSGRDNLCAHWDDDVHSIYV